MEEDENMPESGSEVHLLEANATGERRDGYHDNLFKNETGSLSSSLLSVTGGSRRNLQPTGPAEGSSGPPAQYGQGSHQSCNLPSELKLPITTRTSNQNKKLPSHLQPPIIARTFGQI